MMAKHPILILSNFIMLALTISSCSALSNSSGAYDNQVQAGVAATLTREAFIYSINDARETEIAKNLPTSTPEFSATPKFTNTPEYSPTPDPIHRLLPGSPSTVHMFITDIVTVDLAKEKTALGDNFPWNRLERPYTPKGMQYRSYLDIYQVSLVELDPWIYITIILIGNLPDEGNIRYAVELDNDHDGRGDFLVMTGLPQSDRWTSDLVSVYADNDEDIGGVYPLYMEDPDPTKNGYEQKIFENGMGEDRDLAWSRRDPDHRNQIQLAFKNSLTGTLGFLWSIWTNEGLLDQGLFDFNDHFSYDEAGSPNKGNYRYPVKAVALVDSTCRAWYGYVPSGSEPGLCFTEEQVVKNRSGYGWCEPDPIYSGCGGNQCLYTCPGKRFCIPCLLP
ncbi:MAG: hypothetical protein MUO54_03905 [Anaerolineales bacterium]|nr:hypothetical protein [Anaerolineales bacterium]